MLKNKLQNKIEKESLEHKIKSYMEMKEDFEK